MNCGTGRISPFAVLHCLRAFLPAFPDLAAPRGRPFFGAMTVTQPASQQRSRLLLPPPARA